jgi:hypothetical protein
MAVQYLKEFMSKYKGTSMKLLKKKSDFSAVQKNTSRCHVTASIWILCNILENIPHALDVHAQTVLNYNFILIYDFTIIETGGFSVFVVSFKYIILK